MTEGDMHETIRGLYQGVFDPMAWQRSLYALCRYSESSQASLVVVDAGRHTVLARHAVDIVPGDPARPTRSPALPGGLPSSGSLPVGSWHIDRREVPLAAPARFPLDGNAFDEPLHTSTMTCLVDRQRSHEVYLALQRPAGEAGFSEDDARRLDWAIPHLREAMALRERMHGVAAQSHVSADLLDRLPFGVIVFAESGKALLTNPAGEPWVRRLLPGTAAADAARAMAPGTPGAPGQANGHGWRLSRPFGEVFRALADPGTLQATQAIQAIGADGRAAQIVALAMKPALYLTPDWQGQPVLVTIHEHHGSPRAIPAVLRDLYALTPAECRLAVLLTTGIGLPDACLQLGIKRETSRSQLKSIFTKTNTSTQAQLAHLLTRLGSVLTEPAPCDAR
ncbi:helix-turn-helix transcriptional regulator [Cupriavidus agavae]|uniref:DNA-binding CsgD family transcriptional regulator n=1 Tax=Cupriavidus agavae TaxID=1001822 RepID=A0A4Q7S995_9BURK|nr:helix-turn-helix transcriptional regulator [Cupriavidus agavae]RZT43044.1 DNA-binding CsgD family transcriptional regulator [Cupriavidus agavae]